MTTSKDSNPSETASSVVVLVHGIRTHGEWMNTIKPALEGAGFNVSVTNYGRLDAFRFWLPIPWVRRSAVRHVWTDIRRTMQLHGEARVSFIAHSYGTYVVAEILRSEFDFTAHRVIFCGSIVSRRFPFEQVSERFLTPVVNESSKKDIWPILAKSVTWGYDSSGTHGFMRPDVEDRQHKDYRHSDFLTEQFCQKYWVPFLADGTVVRASHEEVRVPLLARVCSYVPIKYVVLLVVLIIGLTNAGDRLVALADYARRQFWTIGISEKRPIDRRLTRNAWKAGVGVNAVTQEFAVTRKVTANIRGLVSQTRPFLRELGVDVALVEEVPKENFLKERMLPLVMGIASKLEASHGTDISAVFRIAMNLGPTTGAMKRYIQDASFRDAIEKQGIEVAGLTAGLDEPLGLVTILPVELKEEWTAILKELTSGTYDGATAESIDVWRVKVKKWATDGEGA